MKKQWLPPKKITLDGKLLGERINVAARSMCDVMPFR